MVEIIGLRRLILMPRCQAHTSRRVRLNQQNFVTLSRIGPNGPADTETASKPMEWAEHLMMNHRPIMAESNEDPSREAFSRPRRNVLPGN